MAADTHAEHPGRLEPVAEYWHIDPNDEGMAGPYASIEEAQKDAELILHSYRYRVSEIRIVKTVSVSKTAVSYDTQWGPPTA